MELHLYGDSIMKGVRWDGERYKLCEHRNFEALGEKGVTVVNRSQMGATVEKGLALWREEEKEKTVLFEYGGNDCDFDWQAVSDDPGAKHEPHVTPERFCEQYEKLIRQAQAQGNRVILSRLVPVDAEKYFAWISRGRSKENILAWLGDVGRLARWQERYDRLVCELAARLDCPLLDLRDPFLARRDFASLLCADGIHPTQAGHDLIEQTLCKTL